MTPRLENLVQLSGIPLEEVAIAIAAEFGPVDASWVRCELDRLAARVGALDHGDAKDRAETLLVRLGHGEGFDSGLATRPEGLLIDHVLVGREGHPLLLAVVYAGVARRAGAQLYPAGSGRFVVLGDQSADPPLAVDPVPGGRRTPREMRWLCPHLVAALILRALATHWRQHGEVERALRALELRLVLPLAPAVRAGHERDLRSLRATLN